MKKNYFKLKQTNKKNGKKLITKNLFLLFIIKNLKKKQENTWTF